MQAQPASYYSMTSREQIIGILCNTLGLIVGEKVTGIETTNFPKQQQEGDRQCENHFMIN